MEKKVLFEELTRKEADAYVYFDYEGKHPLAKADFGDKMLTRKIAVIHAKEGRPIAICHLIDSIFIDGKDFDKRVYRDYREMLGLIEKALAPYRVIMADYSENGLLPRVSYADYGSVKYLIDLGKRIVPSGDLLSQLYAAYGEKSRKLQEKANALNLLIKDEAFKKIKEDILSKGHSDELQIQRFIAKRYEEEGMVTDDPPIVAVNSRASNPHFAPSVSDHAEIRRGDLVLIDMWAKINDPEAVYSDITWMAYCGSRVPENLAKAFQVLVDSIDLAVNYLDSKLPQDEVKGYEIDRLVRDFITSKGYGGYFTHRTGHNIGVDVSPHGPGPNIDDYESKDDRRLVPCTSFSLEPGIYTPGFGMRSETDVYIDAEGRPHVVAGRQREIIPLFGL